MTFDSTVDVPYGDAITLLLSTDEPIEITLRLGWTGNENSAT